jgi:hypothetical protein
MSEEKKTISVQVPAEYLKNTTASSGPVNAEQDTGAMKSVTLEVTPEQLKLLIAWREDFEAYQQSQVDNSQKSVDKYIKTSELRISFYEKLILLAGGSFALSLTFLVSLQRNVHQSNSLVAMGKLKAAWILLLVSIVLSWLHNFYRCSVVDNAMAASATFVTSVQQALASQLATRAADLFKAMDSTGAGLSDFMALGSTSLQDLSKKTREDGKEFVKGFQRFHIISSAVGFLALLSIILAFWLMIQFALRNATLL